MTDDAEAKRGRFRTFVGEWIEKCMKRWVLFITLVAGTSGVVYAASEHWQSLRPWASRYELYLIAERAYPRALKDQQLLSITIQQRIDWLETQAAKLKPDQYQELIILRSALQDSKNEETRILHEEAKFKEYREYR
jgi:hypothetical protein